MGEIAPVVEHGMVAYLTPRQNHCEQSQKKVPDPFVVAMDEVRRQVCWGRVPHADEAPGNAVDLLPPVAKKINSFARAYTGYNNGMEIDQGVYNGAVGVTLLLTALDRSLVKSEFEAGGKWGTGSSTPGEVSWVNGKPFYDPENFTTKVPAGLNSTARAGVEAHELTHISQFTNQAGKVWYSTTWYLPGRSIPMYQLESQAYKAQSAVIGETYRAWMPLQSENMLRAAGTDALWGFTIYGLTTVSGEAPWLNSGGNK